MSAPRRFESVFGAVAPFALAAAVAGMVANAATIPVANHSFESPSLSPGGTGTPADWTLTAGVGSGSGGGILNGFGSDGIEPRPDGTSQNAYSSGGDFYQILAANIQPNTTYTLTVDMGKRTSLDFPDEGYDWPAGVFNRIGVGNTFGGDLLPFASETSPAPPTAGGWTTWTATFNSGPNPTAGALRVELINASAQQPQFDNVRLEEAATPAVTPNVTRDVFVFNHSFERNGNVGNGEHTADGWINGWERTGELTGLNQTLLTGNPDGTTNQAFSYGDELYQVTGEIITADTTYTLTVDLGSRTDGIGFPDGVAIRLGAGDAFGADILTADGIFNPTPAVGTWEEWTFTTTVAEGSPLIGDFLRIELYNPGGQQPQYDNVRLTAFTSVFIPEPASLTLLALAGVTLLRKRTRR